MEFPKHLSLHIRHNEHKKSYETVESYLVHSCGEPDFKNNAERQGCIDTDEIWEIQIYEKTPGGFSYLAASTFNGLMEYVSEIYKDWPNINY
jgi:hypothetical protein